MFTGIVESTGTIAAIESRGSDARLHIHSGSLELSDVVAGDSICVNGVCLTVTALTPDGFWVDVSGETLSKTTLAGLESGARLNLEKAMLPTTRLGGHLVSGHVDGVAEVISRADAGRSVQFRIRVPDMLAKYIAIKGSVCVDGVSLTVNAVDGAVFDINIIPHTLDATIIGDYTTGQQVNLEVDVVARYLERLLQGDKAAQAGGQGISEALLKRHGFIK